ncbi:MAG: hypothetical protein IJG57_05560 [Firmicutes bacterium]|jgi:hypothetical protein|nr:hypothetical protein [Bacillota bacterium]
MYILGHDEDLLKDRDVIRFFDVDGVLAVYGFGDDGVYVVKDDRDYDEYLKTHDVYETARAPEFMKAYVEACCDPAKSFVISRSYTDVEDDQKIRFIRREYPQIPPENILFVRGTAKTDIARQVLQERFGGLSAKHLCIDDTLDHLEKYQAEGLRAVHISSLLLLAELKGE